MIQFTRLVGNAFYEEDELPVVSGVFQGIIALPNSEIHAQSQRTNDLKK